MSLRNRQDDACILSSARTHSMASDRYDSAGWWPGATRPQHATYTDVACIRAFFGVALVCWCGLSESRARLPAIAALTTHTCGSSKNTTNIVHSSSTHSVWEATTAWQRRAACRYTYAGLLFDNPAEQQVHLMGAHTIRSCT